MKKCPLCAEEIQDDALKCRYCGSDLTNKNKPTEVKQPKGEETKICPQCKEIIKKGAVTCPHCRANLFYQEHPNTLGGILIGVVSGFVIYYVKNHDFGTFLTTVIGGCSYALSGGFIGAIIGFIIDVIGFNKIKLNIPERKYKIGVAVIALSAVALFLFMSFMPFMPFRGKTPLEKERQAYQERKEKIMQKEPKSAEDYKDRADYYMSENPDQAIAEYSKAIEINPDDGEAYSYRALMYFTEKEYDRAWADIRKAQALGYEVPPKLIEDLNRASAQPPEYQATDTGSQPGSINAGIQEKNIALQGIFVDYGGKNSAMINGKVVFEGDSVSGIIVDKINKDSVDIVVNGEKKNIKIK